MELETSYADRQANLGVLEDWSWMASFPVDPATGTPLAGLESTYEAVQPSPQMSSIDSIWNSLEDTSESALAFGKDAVKNVYGGIKDIGKTVYGDIRTAAGTVYDDVSRPVEETAKTTYWYILLGVVVIFGGLYYAGKSGALRVSLTK